MKEVNNILKEQLDIIAPSIEDFEKINKISKDFQLELSENLKKHNIKAQVFLGGSLAKKTLVKKDQYDIDIFVRFDKSYQPDKISSLLKKAVPNAKLVHGSRDYYQIIKDNIIIEIIPTINIKNPHEATNVTDLSYFHVNYILKQINKNKNLTKEIQIAKTFVHAQNAYGAESYIHGFSGYAIELLISHYKTFIKFIQEIIKVNPKKAKLIIDQEKHYKNTQEASNLLNPSKKISPIIIIDPTYKERNASSSLSEETLYRFQNHCKSFLKNPLKKFFIKRSIEENFKNQKPIILIIKTNKQAGDIAGTKSKKFANFLISIIKKEFTIKKDGFEYDEEKNTAKLYLILDKKSPSQIKGPPISSPNNLAKFKKVHPNTIIKNQFAFATIKHNLTFNQWFQKFKKDYKKIIGEMGIIKLN